jgi:hypothetical protein
MENWFYELIPQLIGKDGRLDRIVRVMRNASLGRYMRVENEPPNELSLPTISCMRSG